MGSFPVEESDQVLSASVTDSRSADPGARRRKFVVAARNTQGVTIFPTPPPDEHVVSVERLAETGGDDNTGDENLGDENRADETP